MKCSWLDCESNAARPELDINGREWANLCDAHSKKFNDALRSGDVKKIRACWVRAQGGAKKAAARMGV